MHRSISAAVIVAATLAGAGAAWAATAPVPAELPAALKPSSVYGSGFNVIDLEAQRAWYESHLGMKVVRTFARDGKTFEYIMGLADGGAILALLKTERPAGPNGFSRAILMAPNGKALADRLAAQGAPTREVAPGAAWFITDPEGNIVEIVQQPKP